MLRIFWLTVIGFAAFLFARDLANSGLGLSIDGDAMWGRDFVNVFTSGTLVLESRTDILYDVAAYQAFQDRLFDGGIRNHLFSYPPCTLLFAWLFGIMPYPVAWIAWLAGTGTLFAWAARPYLRDAGLPGWAAWIAPASLMNIWAGHYGFLIGALWLLAWSNLRTRPVLAGILVGLMLMKPHLAVLAPLALAWRREWVAFGSAAVTCLLLVLSSAILFGPELWITYLTETSAQHAAMVDDVGSFFLLMMPTLLPALALLGIPLLVAAAMQAALAIATIFLLFRYMPSDDRKAALCVGTGTFLVLPYAFAYDMTVVGLAGLILLKQSLGVGRRYSVFLIAMAAATPVLVIYLNHFRIPVTAPLIGFQLLALLGLVGPRGIAGGQSPEEAGDSIAKADPDPALAGSDLRSHHPPD